MGLPPGSYQRNAESGQITPIGRQRAQYGEFAGQSAQFASRMEAADATLRSLEETVDPIGVFAAQTGGGTQEQRQLRQAQREFVNAILRRESGAAIGSSEFESARQQYFPQPGDGPEVIAQKRAARRRSIDGLINASQGAYAEWYGDRGDGGEEKTTRQAYGVSQQAAPGPRPLEEMSEEELDEIEQELMRGGP